MLEARCGARRAMKSSIDIAHEHCFRCDATLGKRYLVMSCSKEIRRFSEGGHLVLVELHRGGYEFGRFCSEHCADKHVRRIFRRDGLRLRKEPTADKPTDALLELLHAKEERIRALRRQHSDLQSRLAGIESIRGEIDGEIKTLSLNEESKRVFESFFDVCGRADCGLFVSSSASYAKNLMYLKDQIKDLEANAARAEVQLASLDARLVDEEAERGGIASKLQHRDGQGVTGQLVSAVQSITRELLETEQRRVAIERLIEEKRKYIQFDEERAKTQDRIAMLSNHGRSDFEFNKLRLQVRELTVKWMDILDTPNASREVDIDLEFKFRFGREPIDVFTGSTRSRLILAVHAALFEHYLQDVDRPFRFLILDTPKQQELDSADLARFLNALQAICDQFGGQILISATEYHHAIEAADIEWLPQFPGEKKLMYLGAPKQLNS